MKRAIAALVLAGLMHGCQAPAPTAHYSRPCRIVTIDTLNAAIEFAYRVDYQGGNPGRWLVQDDQGGDWQVLGFAQEEDSTIYRTVRCALAH